MRKLKLQMHMTMDGFVGRTNGDTDWIWLPGERDENGLQDVIKLAQSCDTLLLGRKMTRVFVDHWENMADNQPDNPAHHLAQLLVNMPKIVFSKTENNQ